MNRKVDFKRPVFWLFVAWTIGVLYGSLAPGDDLPPTGWLALIPYFDKLVHFGFYFGEIFWALLLFTPRGAKQWGWLVGVILFSGMIECLQGWLGYRSRDAVDFLANSVGAIAGFVAVRLLLKSRWRKWFLPEECS